jgi:hypothetical protein
MNSSNRALLTLFVIGIIGAVMIIATSLPNRYQNVNAQSIPTCTSKDTSDLDFLWQHIHDFKINQGKDERLPIYNYCIAVSGNITSQDVDPDGDIHMMLKLDRSYQHYSTETGSKQGEIVIEAICQKPAQYDKAKAACNGVQKDFLKIPPTGTHVFVTGSYVLDAENNWREIHPIASIYAHQ